MVSIMKILVMSGLVLLSATSSAQTQIDYNRALVTVAGEVENGYFRMQPIPSLGCKYEVVYFPLSTPSGRAKLALLLTGKAMQKALSVVSYSKDAAGLCWAQTIELEP